jgi:hypothetical protein
MMTHACRRRGYGLLEMAIAALMLAVAMALVVQAASWLAAERRGAERRQRAVQEAANLMERLTSLPWDELTPGRAAAQTLSPATREILRDGSLTVDVSDEPGDPPARRVAIRIGWGSAAPVRLVAWVHRRGGKP